MSLNLFQDIPLQFFRPLAGVLAPVYGSVLTRLYELDFEGEPFEITHETAIEQTAQLIEQNPQFIQNTDRFREQIQEDLAGVGTVTAESGEETMERESRRLARYLLKRLECCGWFDYEYREARKGYVLNFRDYAARVLHTLVQVAKREQPLFEGLAQSIKAALGQQEILENPGVALYNAQESTRNLVREIKILSRNIRRYIDQALQEAKTTKELLELQLDIYQKKVVDSSYHRFKTTDNIFRYRAFILKQLELFEEGGEIFERAREWYEKNPSSGTEPHLSASGAVQDCIHMIRNQLGSIHLFVEDLDRKNARYTATTLQRIGYLLNQDHLIENKLYRLLDELGRVSAAGSYAPPPEFSAFKLRTWDQYSLYRRPKEKAEMKLEDLSLPQVLDATKEQVLAKARASVDAQFSKKKVHELARALLSGRNGTLPLSEAPLATLQDFTHLIFISYHGFDRRAPYRIQLSTDWKERPIKTGTFEIRDGELSWKEE